MTIEFSIQASNPRVLRTYDSNDESLSDAIQTVFPLDTEWALITWNGIFTPLNYKYDWSLLADDVIALLDDMLANARGAKTIHWPSNTFSSIWSITWTDETVVVRAQWNCVLGGLLDLLRAKPIVTTSKSRFMAEWKRPLQVIGDALRTAGYSVEQLPSLAQLEAVCAKVPGSGELYGVEE